MVGTLRVERINALPENHVLECLLQESGESIRLVILHTSPSHYEALGHIVTRNAKHLYPHSGPMTAELLVHWLDTLLVKWNPEGSISWREHPLDEATRQFIATVRQSAAEIANRATNNAAQTPGD
ncbi:MAG: hypothetical protein ACOYW9_01120 [Deinococcota bacterium]|uniref:hypothetical protein n=1 Tax=Thermaceae TaxID=188786 RepID=UPI002356B064|nr:MULTISPECIES: hypothetical protein [Thermaceae]MBI5812675.1 hypothetical protein [Allomeiothermus silvanus]MCL6529106.1 hypothetical protein [Meiothermus ruber]